MAKELIRVIDEDLFIPSWGFETDRIRTIRYGKCLKSPYIENNLWFITIPIGLPTINIYPSSPKEAVEPRIETTFIVAEQYARPDVIDDLKRDLEKWQKIAHKILNGDWCSPLEKLWQDVPIYKHTLPNTAIIKYGYCRSQDDLWLVSFKDANPNNDDHTFIVDEVCIQPEFMNHLAIDWKKWSSVCWCHLMSEVKWDELKTGMDSKQVGYYSLENKPSAESMARYQREMKNAPLNVRTSVDKTASELAINRLRREISELKNRMPNKDSLLWTLGQWIAGLSVLPACGFCLLFPMLASMLIQESSILSLSYIVSLAGACAIVIFGIGGGIGFMVAGSNVLQKSQEPYLAKIAEKQKELEHHEKIVQN